MKVKRYFAANMRSALEMVRQAQGPDVIILSDRQVDGGVELLTADGDPDPALLERFTPKPRESRPTPPAPAATSASAGRAAPEGLLWTREDTLAQMQRELTGLRSLLEQQLSALAWGEFGGRNPLRARLLRVTARLGLAPRLGRELVDEIPETLNYDGGWQCLLDLLKVRLPVLDDPILRRGGHVALCGPTGVGKTTLASKLAARYALAHGAESVALVSADDQRLGAHQQIKTVGRLLGIRVHAVRNFEDLPEQLAELHDEQLVLIDMPGIGPDDGRFRQSLAALYGLPRAVSAYLVVAATTEYQSLARCLGVAAEARLAGCCLTKLDEAAIIGPALSAIMEARLPLAYLCAGQQVPEDLEPAARGPLLRRLVSLAQQTPMPAESAQLEQAFAF